MYQVLYKVNRFYFLKQHKNRETSLLRFNERERERETEREFFRKVKNLVLLGNQQGIGRSERQQKVTDCTTLFPGSTAHLAK